MGDTPLVSFNAIFDYLSKKKKKERQYTLILHYFSSAYLKFQLKHEFLVNTMSVQHVLRRWKVVCICSFDGIDIFSMMI